MKYLVEFYSGDEEYYNTPVLVDVIPEDAENFEYFLSHCNDRSYETLSSEEDNSMFKKYFTYMGHILWPEDVCAINFWDSEPTKPARFYSFHKEELDTNKTIIV